MGGAWSPSHPSCLEKATLVVATGPGGCAGGAAGHLRGLGHPWGDVPGGWGSTLTPSPPLSAHSKLTRESGTDFPIPVIPPVADVETEKLIREKDEEVSVGRAEPPSAPSPLPPPRPWHSRREPLFLQRPGGCCSTEQGLEVHPRAPPSTSPAPGDPSLSGMLSPGPTCTGAAWPRLGTTHDPGSAPFQLRRMQEMLQKIQKQMKDSH